LRSGVPNRRSLPHQRRAVAWLLPHRSCCLVPHRSCRLPNCAAFKIKAAPLRSAATAPPAPSSGLRPRSRGRAKTGTAAPLTGPAHPGTLCSVCSLPIVGLRSTASRPPAAPLSRSASPSLDPALLRLRSAAASRTEPTSPRKHAYELRPAHHPRWRLDRCCSTSNPAGRMGALRRVTPGANPRRRSELERHRNSAHLFLHAPRGGQAWLSWRNEHVYVNGRFENVAAIAELAASLHARLVGDDDEEYHLDGSSTDWDGDRPPIAPPAS